MTTLPELTQRLDNMIEDVRDSMKARAQSESGTIELCGCGAYTPAKPCPACRRKRAAATNKNGE